MGEFKSPPVLPKKPIVSQRPKSVSSNVGLGRVGRINSTPVNCKNVSLSSLQEASRKERIVRQNKINSLSSPANKQLSYTQSCHDMNFKSPKRNSNLSNVPEMYQENQACSIYS